MSLKVVFDTNIFISAFAVPGKNAEKAYLLAIHGAFTLYTSVSILTEIGQKLAEKFGWPEDRIAQLLKAISSVAKVLKTRGHLHILTDEPDNRILECAMEAEADLIVTGDKHLLSLKQFEGILIVVLSDFLHQLSA